MEDDMKKMWEELQTPLHPMYISIKTETRKGRDIDMPFIDYTDLILLLNDICGLNWSFTPVIVKDDGSYCEMMGHLTIAGVTRSNIGDGEGDNYGGARKKAIANTLVRCAMLFGLGLELWKDPAGAMRRRREWERQQGQQLVEQPSVPAKTTKKPAVPWVQGDLKAFWTFAKGSLGLSETEVHDALEVESVLDFTSSKADAMKRLTAYAEEKAAALQGGAEIDEYLERGIA